MNQLHFFTVDEEVFDIEPLVGSSSLACGIVKELTYRYRLWAWYGSYCVNGEIKYLNGAILHVFIQKGDSGQMFQLLGATDDAQFVRATIHKKINTHEKIKCYKYLWSVITLQGKKKHFCHRQAQRVDYCVLHVLAFHHEQYDSECT